MIKPDAVNHAGEIIERINDEDIVICQAKKIVLSRYHIFSNLFSIC